MGYTIVALKDKVLEMYPELKEHDPEGYRAVRKAWGAA